MHYAAIN